LSYSRLLLVNISISKDQFISITMVLLTRLWREVTRMVQIMETQESKTGSRYGANRELANDTLEKEYYWIAYMMGYIKRTPSKILGSSMRCDNFYPPSPNCKDDY
jgi:hypothetical protein